MGRKIDLTGQRFDRLLVIEEAGRKNGFVTWLCKCNCGSGIIINGSSLRTGNTKSCGCYNKEQVSKRMKGKIVSIETKKKLSEAHKGKIHSKEAKEKMSKIKFGENNPNYNPNLTDEERHDKRKYPEYKEWHKNVYERDNYTCQVCGDNKGGNLVAHHLDNHKNNKELRTVLSNGITMCTPCHLDFHHIYGYDCTKEQFEEFIKDERK